jgi:alkaline phosphatase D
MLSHLEMREAKVWLQCDAPSLVRIRYFTDTEQANPHWSIPVETDSKNGHTASVTLDQIEPGQNYQYQVELNGELVGDSGHFSSPANYHNRTPPPDFKIAIGGAHYVMEEGFEPPYQILGGGYQIFNSIVETHPQLMIWAGNTTHLRQSDWTTKSGYLKRYATARSIPELQTLLKNIPNYATWSTHDFGAPNAGMHSATRQIATDTFNAYWPRPIQIKQLEGVATQFRYADVDFFILDVCSYRNDTPTSSTRIQILGEEQVNWLRQALIDSQATFKVIVAGAPILNPADSRSNLSYADSEHTRFLQMMREEKISGLFFLSGGKSYGELTRLVHASSYNLYDLTVGPMTATPGNNEDELNFFRQPGSSTFERHFALIEFSGPEEARVLTIRVISTEGKELWNRAISASELQPAN